MRWSVVVPVFNEAAYLPRTLLSLAEQDTAFHLIIVDNASTDGCVAAARDLVRERGLSASFLTESVPGQVHALKRGVASVDTGFVAICDADTWYPPHYLSRAQALFEAGGPARVATAAWLRPEGEAKGEGRPTHRVFAARLMPRQNHTSGAAHCFRTAALRAAGGYDAAIWPYVLKDHELMHRVLKQGSQAYDRDLWCVTSERREDRRKVRWTLAERLAYHLTPFHLKDGFFRRLAARFEARGQRDVVLRQRSWDESRAAS